MTRIEYELLAEQEPQLRLPPWFELKLSPMNVGWIRRMTRDELLSARTAQIIMHGLKRPRMILHERER